MMNRLLCGVLFLLVAGMARAGDPAKMFYQPAGTVHELVQALQDKMPPGWSVSFSQDCGCVRIERDNEIMAESTVPNQGSDQKAERVKFSLELSIVPLMSKETHQKFKDENQQLQRTLDSMRHEFGIVEMFGGDWGVPGRAANDNDRKHIAIYKVAEARWHDLPEFYFREISLEWNPQDPDVSGFYPYAPVDGAILNECKGVIKKIEGVLSTY